MTLTTQDVHAAAARVRGRVRRTPVLELPPREAREARLTLKLEFVQGSGSFKLRGATNRILLEPGCRRVVAASGGNHGAAVALAARELGLDADIFVPGFASPHKLRQIESYGARVHRLELPFTQVARRAAEYAENHEALFVHPFEDPEVLAGQGTLGLELVHQCPTATRVVVAVGGGGLATGIAVALAGAAEVVCVEAAECPSLQAAFEHGGPVEVPVGGVAADALGAPVIGRLAFEVLRRGAPPILVADDEILRAQRDLWESLRIAAEPAAACAWAALEHLSPAAPGDHTVVVICGGNVELEQFGRTCVTANQSEESE